MCVVITALKDYATLGFWRGWTITPYL